MIAKLCVLAICGNSVSGLSMSARLRCHASISSMVEVLRRRAAIAEEHLILTRPHH